jgi:hypothetical protein
MTLQNLVARASATKVNLVGANPVAIPSCF